MHHCVLLIIEKKKKEKSLIPSSRRTLHRQDFSSLFIERELRPSDSSHRRGSAATYGGIYSSWFTAEPPPIAPSRPPSGYSRCRCETIDACRRQKKGAALPTEPLPLTAGLLIQTLKALALSNPCFTLAAPAFSWQRPFDDNCSNNEKWRR